MMVFFVKDPSNSLEVTICDGVLCERHGSIVLRLLLVMVIFVKDQSKSLDIAIYEGVLCERPIQ